MSWKKGHVYVMEKGSRVCHGKCITYISCASCVSSENGELGVMRIRSVVYHRKGSVVYDGKWLILNLKIV